MTKEELAFSTFDNLFDYEWYAQPDGGVKTVIFSYVPKDMYKKPKEQWSTPIRFEAESLEKAFNYAFIRTEIIPENWSLVGRVTKFDFNKWSIVDKPTGYFSICDNCWKPLKYEEAN